MDIKKREECVSVIKKSNEEITIVFSEKIFTENKNLDLIIRAAIFRNPYSVDLKKHLSSVLKELYQSKPTLTIECFEHTDFFDSEHYYSNHPYIKELRKSKGLLFRSSIPTWVILIKLFESDFILINLDDLSHIEMQCVQMLIQDAFHISSRSIRNNVVKFSSFKFNEELNYHYDRDELIKRFFLYLEKLNTNSKDLIDEIVEMTFVKGIKKLWKHFKKQNL